jgi:hypothetical protein
MSNQFFEPNESPDKAFLEVIKREFKKENLNPNSKVKTNLDAAFKAKNASNLVLTLNRNIPIWQVAASLLLLITAIYWLRPFEKTVIVEAKPLIETQTIVKEKIVYQTDTLFIEKPVIQYVEKPSTTKTIIDKPIDKSRPIAVVLPNNNDEKKLSLDDLQLNFEVLDNFYDTALVKSIEGRTHGQSMGEMNYESFDSLVLN